MSISVMVAGAMGRMGQQVLARVLENSELELVGALERAGHSGAGEDVGRLSGFGDLGVRLETDFLVAAEKADVYIDFTQPQAAIKNLILAKEKSLAAVLGLTGFSENEKQILNDAAKKIPVLWAPNMSLGVNLLYRLSELAAKALGDDFDIEIVEAHHNQKKDAPSGTALKLFEVLSRARSENKTGDAPVTGRSGQVGARTKGEIGVLSVRGGDIVGDHTVYLAGPGERLELVHRAHSRNTFARGAIRCALWLSHRQPGLYSIDDVLEI